MYVTMRVQKNQIYTIKQSVIMIKYFGVLVKIWHYYGRNTPYIVRFFFTKSEIHIWGNNTYCIFKLLPFLLHKLYSIDKNVKHSEFQLFEKSE